MLVVGTNLATDRTLRMTELRPGAVQRPLSALVTAGGKAVNVCRAAVAHGVRPRLVANLPGRLGAYVGDLLDAEGHDVHRVVTAGEIRAATIVIEADLRTTVLNEPGPDLSREDRDALMAAVVTGYGDHRVAVFSGSLPPGPDQEFYADAVAAARGRGVTVLLDAARTALAAALPHRPDVVTPNVAEALGVLTGAGSESVEPEYDDVRAVASEAAAGLCDLGARTALVTAGRHGVAVAGEHGSWWVQAPAVTEVNAIGAGDAFMAGLGCGLELGEDLPAAVHRAVASGAASVTTPLAGHVDPATMAELRAMLQQRVRS